jgi:hypothetical protein
MASWIRRGPLTAPLVTVGDSTGLAVIGQPGTVVVFGGNGLDFSTQSGFRADAGIWLDPDERLSLDVGGFYLAPTRVNFSIASDANGNPFIGRPIINFNPVVGPLGNASELISMPGFISGSSTVEATTDLYGIETNARYREMITPRLELESLVGFRYMNLHENLQITDRATNLGLVGPLAFLGNFVNAGDMVVDFDSFSTTNRFFGIQFGEKLRRGFGPFYLDAMAHVPVQFDVSVWGKVALGGTSETVNINGQTALLPVGGPVQTAPGGILALPSNIGSHHRTVFGIVPEAGISIGMEITPHVRIQAAYSFLLWSAVARPGAQIDTGVNPSQIPSDSGFGLGGGPNRPLFAFHDEVFWVQNVFVGVEFRR